MPSAEEVREEAPWNRCPAEVAERRFHEELDVLRRGQEGAANGIAFTFEDPRGVEEEELPPRGLESSREIPPPFGLPPGWTCTQMPYGKQGRTYTRVSSHDGKHK